MAECDHPMAECDHPMAECDHPMAECDHPMAERSRSHQQRRQTNYPRGGDLSASIPVPSTSLRELDFYTQIASAKRRSRIRDLARSWSQYPPRP